jgi:hypothetical protein
MGVLPPFPVFLPKPSQSFLLLLLLLLLPSFAHPEQHPQLSFHLLSFFLHPPSASSSTSRSSSLSRRHQMKDSPEPPDIAASSSSVRAPPADPAASSTTSTLQHGARQNTAQNVPIAPQSSLSASRVVGAGLSQDLDNSQRHGLSSNTHLQPPIRIQSLAVPHPTMVRMEQSSRRRTMASAVIPKMPSQAPANPKHPHASNVSSQKLVDQHGLS